MVCVCYNGRGGGVFEWVAIVEEFSMVSRNSRVVAPPQWLINPYMNGCSVWLITNAKICLVCTVYHFELNRG